MLIYICCIGGAKGTGYTYDGPPIVFDLTKMQWVTTYTPPAYLLNSPETTSATPPPGATSSGPQTSSPTAVSSAKDSNLGAILGGTFGSLFVIALAALIYIYLLRRSDKVKYAAPIEQRSDRDDKGPDQRALAEGHGRRDPQEMTGFNLQSLDRGPMYAVNLDSKDYAANSVATTPGANNQINPGFVPTNNIPMVYPSQPGYTAPGGVILLPNGQQANVVYLTQHPGHVIQPQVSNGTIFNTNMASCGNNTIPVSQVAFSNSAIYNTSPMPLSPTTTQQYMDGFVPLANLPQHTIAPIASVAHHTQMSAQAPLTAQHYGAPVSVAPAPSLAKEGSELSSTVQSTPHDRYAYVGGQSASSLSRNRNNRRRSTAPSADSEPSSATVWDSTPSQEGSQYYTANVPGFASGQTSEVNVNPDQNQNQSYWLPPPVPPRIP